MIVGSAAFGSGRRGSCGDGWKVSQGTLNPLPMIGGLTAGHRTDLEKLVFSAKTVAAILRDCAVGIGNENDQVS